MFKFIRRMFEQRSVEYWEKRAEALPETGWRVKHVSDIGILLDGRPAITYCLRDPAGEDIVMYCGESRIKTLRCAVIMAEDKNKSDK